MKTNYKGWLIVACIALLLCAIWGIYNKIDASDAHANLDIELKKATTIATTTGQKVSVVTRTIGSTAQLQAASDSIFKLTRKNEKLIKEVSRLSIIAQKVSTRDTLHARYVDNRSLPVDANCDSILSISVLTPAAFVYKSDSIDITGIVQTDRVDITGVHLENRMFDRDVIEKTGFLKLGKKRSTQILNSNPLWVSDSAAVFTVPYKPSRWHKVGKPVVAGTLASLITVAIIKAFVHP